METQVAAGDDMNTFEDSSSRTGGWPDQPNTPPSLDDFGTPPLVESVNSNTNKAPAGLRSKSSLRIRYEAEITVLKRKIGDLEQIRQQLGLSQRKICQLLMVDPSAWSRWTREGGQEAPPHIYRALQWYLALQEKYPALDVSFWLSTAPRAQESQIHDSAWASAVTDIEELRAEVRRLREELSTPSIPASTKDATDIAPLDESKSFKVNGVFFSRISRILMLVFLFGMGLGLILGRING